MLLRRGELLRAADHLGLVVRKRQPAQVVERLQRRQRLGAGQLGVVRGLDRERGQLQTHGSQLEDGPEVAQAREKLVVGAHLGIQTRFDPGEPAHLTPVAVGDTLQVRPHPTWILRRSSAWRPQGSGVPLCWPA